MNGSDSLKKQAINKAKNITGAASSGNGSTQKKKRKQEVGDVGASGSRYRA